MSTKKSQTAEQLLAQLMSRDVPVQRVMIEHVQLDPNTPQGQDPVVTTYEESPFFVRVMTVPQYTEIKADINRAGGLHLAEPVIFTKVIKYALCTEHGELLYDDRAVPTGRVDDTFRSIYQQALEASGFQVPVIRMVKGKPEAQTPPSPSDTIAKN